MAERLYADEWFRFTDNERALLDELLQERMNSMEKKTGEKWSEVVHLKNVLSRYYDD